MASKLEALPGPDYDKLIEELRALAGKPTIKQIQEIAKKFGVSVSTDTAWRFRGGPYARAIERINAGRETREALCAAAGAGVHPLDAIEEATVVALQDHLTEAEEIDIKFVVDQLTKLRASISMRENSRRQQADLERKIADSETARSNSERRTQMLEQRLELLQLDAATAVLKHAKEIKLVVADTKLDQAAKTERVRKILWGERPADWKPITSTGAQVE